MAEPYFEDDKFTLYNDDCLKILDELPEESIDLIFADPPYNLSNGGFTCHAGRMVPVNKGKWDVSKGVQEDFHFHLEWIKKCRKVLKPNGSIWISGTYHSIYQCGYALDLLSYHLLNDICWYKPNASPNLSGRYFTASHETLLWARKNHKGKHKFNYDLTKNGLWKEDRLKVPGKQMRSIWAITTPKDVEKKFGKHPTQKPFDLLKRIILSSSDENDLILDPFTGSSTTGLAAYFYERQFIGIDMDNIYLDLSIKRYKSMKNNISKKMQKQFGDKNLSTLKWESYL